MAQQKLEIGYLPWLVADGGYEIAQAHHVTTSLNAESYSVSDQPVLVIRPVGWEQEINGHEYDAYQGTRDGIRLAILDDFIQITSDPESLLRFVNQYGLVFDKIDYASVINMLPEEVYSVKPFKTHISVEDLRFTFPDQGTQKVWHRYAADDVQKIVTEAGRVRACITILHALSAETEEDKIKRADRLYSIIYKANNIIQFTGNDKFKTSAISIGFEEFQGFSSNASLEYSYQFVESMINTGLSHHPTPIRVIKNQSTDHGRTRLRLFITPDSLMGLIWHKVAAMTGTNDYLRPCSYCGGWFRASRADALTCSDKCRVALRETR